MKQNRNLLIFTALAAVTLLVAGSLASCTKSDLTPDSRDHMKIAPLVALGGSSVEAGSAYISSAQTKAAVSGNQELGLFFARADQTSPSAYEAYGATSLAATRAVGAGNQQLTFIPEQYYRADGLKTKLTGWYPSGTYNEVASTVSWTINGQQDIMTAPMQQGSKTSAMPAMTFNHCLTQLLFYPYAQTQSAVDAWGKITKIEVLNQQNTVVYDLANDATGAVSFSGDKTNNFSAGIAAEGAALSLSTTANKATDAKQMGNAVMIVPQSAANHVLTLGITTENKYTEVTIIQALTAGVPNRLYMDFKKPEIVLEVDYTDNRSPLFDMAKTNVEDPTTGAAKTNWFMATGTVDATHNPTGVKACPDGWRVPTQQELMLLWVYKPALGTAAPAGGNFWSSPESSSDAMHALYVDFSDGTTNRNNKGLSYFVRCVRDL